MRRTDREITLLNDIKDVLNRCDTLRLGIIDTPFPYVVPVSFGFEEKNGVITVYIHGAKIGKKPDLLKKNPYVCVEADIFHGYAGKEHEITALYESVIGFGIAEPVTGEEAKRGLELMLAHCGCAPFHFSAAETGMTLVYKITLSEITGKRNLK